MDNRSAFEKAIQEVLGLTPDMHDKNGRPLWNVDKLTRALGYEGGVDNPEIIRILSTINPEHIRVFTE